MFEASRLMDIVFSREEIAEFVRALGARLNEYYADTTREKPVLVIGVLNGAFVFMADLIRELTFPMEVDFIQIASYGTGTVSSGNIELVKEPRVPVAARRVLIVEDIIDSGHSLEFLRRWFEDRSAEVAIAVLLDKFERREAQVSCEFVGTKVANRFLAGYGLDGGGLLRQLPYIAAVD